MHRFRWLVQLRVNIWGGDQLQTSYGYAHRAEVRIGIASKTVDPNAGGCAVMIASFQSIEAPGNESKQVPLDWEVIAPASLSGL